MPVRPILALMAGTMAQVWLAGPAAAQTGPAPETARPTPVRTVLASAALPSVVDRPLHFKLLRVSLPGGRSATFVGADGFLFQISGTLAVTINGQSSTLRSGEGMFVGAGKRATLRAAGGDPAVFLHFLLVAAADLDKPGASEPAIVTELYRIQAPIRDLKPGPYEFTLTRATLPPRVPLNPPHYRSGAALYYVLTGSGTFAPEGRPEPKPAGSILFEPYGLVHQWGNPGETSLVLLQANISPEGVPVVIMATPPAAPR